MCTIAVAAACVASSTRASYAQDYPQRAIHIVVVAQSDALARAIVPPLERTLGAPVVVESSGGAGGTIAAERVAHARPDGYTLLVGGTNNVVLATLLRSQLPYAPATELEPLGGIARVPYGIAVRPGIPVRNLREFIDYARAHPGELSFASGGTGSSSHVAIELLKSRAGLDILHVPYRGGSAAVPDLVAGRIDVLANALAQLLPLAKAGRVRLIAVGGRRRALAAPDVPTVAEQGLAGYSVEPWYGLFAPAGIPKATRDRLSAALADALSSAEVRRQFAAQGVEPMALSGEALRALAVSETAEYAQVIDAAGLRHSQ